MCKIAREDLNNPDSKGPLYFIVGGWEVEAFFRFCHCFRRIYYSEFYENNPAYIMPPTKIWKAFINFKNINERKFPLSLCVFTKPCGVFYYPPVCGKCRSVLDHACETYPRVFVYFSQTHFPQICLKHLFLFSSHINWILIQSFDSSFQNLTKTPHC